MIREDIKQLKTGKRELRKFGLLVGGVFLALGILVWVRHKPYYPYLLTPGVILIAGGVIFPKRLKQVYIAWMSLAMLLGFVVSTVLLTVFFFLVIMPIGLVARLAGKDFLGLRIHREVSSYWIRREQVAQSKADYERQF